ncbi:Rv3235 family protein [Nocardia asteroides]|uniref:Rv3235 family protein n=1 Tax=Nocardia asteroides TaxID=1824 RepID=UPI0034126EAD
MSTNRLSLSRAPHCEPGLADQPGARVGDSAVPQRVCRPARRNGGAPRGVSLAVRGACARNEAGSSPTAQGFAEKTVRLVLEVADRRRQVDQLRTVAEPMVLAAVRTMLAQNLVPGRGLGSATLTRVRVTPDEGGAAEVFACYQRGPRTLALAGRIEFAKDRWRLVALRLF